MSKRLMPTLNYNRAALLMLGSLSLAACQHTEPGIRVETVSVPTPVPCLPADQIPAEPPLVADQLTGDPAHDIAIVAPSALLLRLALREARAALPACAE